MHDSGASRRGDVNACLVLFLLFEKCEVGVCASLIRLASLHKTHPSCPDLIHGCLARSMLVMPRSPWRGQREYSCAVARRGLHVVRSQIWTVVARGVA